MLKFTSYLSNAREASIMKGIPNTPENRKEVEEFLRKYVPNGGCFWKRGRGPRKGKNVGFGGQSHLALPYAETFAVYWRPDGFDHLDWNVKSRLQDQVKLLINVMASYEDLK
jgi:hypothetical protein